MRGQLEIVLIFMILLMSGSAISSQWIVLKLDKTKTFYTGFVEFIDVNTVTTSHIFSTDGGLSWVERSILSGISSGSHLSAPSLDTLYACGDGGVYLSTDAGETWDSIYRQVRYDGRPLPSRVIGFWNSKSGIVCSGHFLKCEYTHDAGVTWNSVESRDGLGLGGIRGGTYLISVVDSTSVFIIGASAGGWAQYFITKLTSQGSVHEGLVGRLPNAGRGPVFMYFIDTLRGAIISPSGSGETYKRHLFYTLDGVKNWIAVDYTFSEFPSSACFVDSLQGYVGTEEGTIYRTMDGGQTWQEEFRSTSYIGEIFQMKYFPQERILYAVAERAILKRDVPSSVAGERSNSALTLYPNPTTGTLQISGIDLSSSPSALVSITIRDVLGRTLMEASAHDHSTTLDISHIPVGQYIVQVGTGVVLLVKQ